MLLYESTEQTANDKRKTEELVIKLQTKKKNKQRLLVFYFAQKRAKSFLKKVEKRVDKEKKVQYNTKRSRQKQGTIKSTLKSKQ